MTDYIYGWNDEIKRKVAGRASTQLEAASIEKANRYGSEIINSETDRVSGGWDITVDQNTGQLTTTEPFAYAISAIADKLAAQLLRGNFNEQEVKTKLEWQQAMDELASIKASVAKMESGGGVVSGKTIAYSKPSTYPSNPDAQFISGVRKKVVYWN